MNNQNGCDCNGTHQKAVIVTVFTSYGSGFLDPDPES